MPVSPGLSTTWGSEGFSSVLIEALTVEAVLLRSGANRVLTTGRVVHVPRLLVNPRATFIAELEEIRSDAGDADTLDLTPRKLGNLVHLSNESIADASVNELDAVGRAMVRGVATALDAVAYSATRAEAKAPAGLFAAEGLAGVRVRAAITIRDLVTGVGAIAAAGGVANAIVVSPEDLTTLRLEALTGGYLLTADPTAPGIEKVAGAALYSCPALRTKEGLIYDARYLTVAVRKDATVDFSAESGFSTDATDARVLMRVDLAPSDVRAFYHIAPEA